MTDPKFRLLFLRSERFHAQRTARKMVGYFEYKCDLFGADKLVKKITLDDLSKDDRTTLQTGAMQILPNRDKSGRAVFFECQKFWRFQEPDNQVRGMMDGKENENIRRDETCEALLFASSSSFLGGGAPPSSTVCFVSKYNEKKTRVLNSDQRFLHFSFELTQQFSQNIFSLKDTSGLVYNQFLFRRR